MKQMLKRSFSLLLILALALPAFASNHRTTTITFQPLNYKVTMTWWENRFEPGVVDMGGSILATVTNDRGEVVANKVGLSKDYDDNILNGIGDNYEVFVSTGKMLEALGGISGFVSFFKAFPINLPELKSADGDDAVMLLMNKKHEVTLASGKAVTVNDN